MILRIPDTLGKFLYRRGNRGMTMCKIPYVYLFAFTYFPAIVFVGKKKEDLIWYLSTNPNKDNWKSRSCEFGDLGDNVGWFHYQ